MASFLNCWPKLASSRQGEEVRTRASASWYGNCEHIRVSSYVSISDELMEMYLEQDNPSYSLLLSHKNKSFHKGFIVSATINESIHHISTREGGSIASTFKQWCVHQYARLTYSAIQQGRQASGKQRKRRMIMAIIPWELMVSHLWQIWMGGYKRKGRSKTQIRMSWLDIDNVWVVGRPLWRQAGREACMSWYSPRSPSPTWSIRHLARRSHSWPPPCRAGLTSSVALWGCLLSVEDNTQYSSVGGYNSMIMFVNWNNHPSLPRSLANNIRGTYYEGCTYHMTHPPGMGWGGIHMACCWTG